MAMRLSELHTGQKATIVAVRGEGAFRKRILEMGFVRGQEIEVIQNAPLKDPIYYRIMDYNVSLRREDASLVEVSLEAPSMEVAQEDLLLSPSQERSTPPTPQAVPPFSEDSTPEVHRPIRVALVGNPNCGKTSIFNLASGAHERVGNYSGVTVEAKEAHMEIDGKRIQVIDLPGSYSLSPYSPEELYIRQYLTDPSTRPDVVIDVVDVCNIERNLYLTMQIKELEIPMVMALNMFDEFEHRGDLLDIPLLSTLLDIPMTPTVGRKERGITELFRSAIEVAENRRPVRPEPPVKINYGRVIEGYLESLEEKIRQHLSTTKQLPPRYIAIKLLEGDAALQTEIQSLAGGGYISSAMAFAKKNIAHELHSDDLEGYITDRRYGFIAGALRETYKPLKRTAKTPTDKIDNILIHPIWGYPLFIAVLFLMFQTTFSLGEYPMSWIEQGVTLLGSWVKSIMSDGPLRDLLVKGVIGGVGGVIVFLPNILILYLFISIMEDTGYMARASFLMDKLMHKMGLHGKSFIPLIMGFGCNVPSVMATRTIESRQSRLITMLVTPFMSCNARLPVYILLAGAFFPQHVGLVFLALYLSGILVAVLSAKVIRKVLFEKEDVPFVMELPPYRIPTLRSVLIHMWEKGKEYLHKMGSIILLASIIIWFLGYFPHYSDDELIARFPTEANRPETNLGMLRQEKSILGTIGKTVEPVLSPLGFDWKMSIAVVSGLPAKEVVVSTMGVIYTGDDSDDDEAVARLSDRLIESQDSQGNPSFSPLVAMSFMLFVLLYFPCIATIVAISKESHSYKWGIFVVVYTCLLAWIASFVLYQTGLFFGLG